MLNPAAAAAVHAAAARHSSSSTSGSSVGGGPVPSGFKVNILESVDRIKEEFNFMQSQYHK